MIYTRGETLSSIFIDGGKYVRENQEDVITKNGFNIKEEGKKLEEEYIKLLGKRSDTL